MGTFRKEGLHVTPSRVHQHCFGATCYLESNHKYPRLMSTRERERDVNQHTQTVNTRLARRDRKSWGAAAHAEAG